MITITTNEHFRLDDGIRQRGIEQKQAKRGSLDHDHPNHVWYFCL
jgi:hypothetical protein